MTNKKMPKNAEIFSCKICNFECFKQSNFDKHLNTAKHKRLTNTNKKMPKNATAYSCICGKIYKHNSSLCKHKKSCSITNNSIIISENNVNELNNNSTILNLISQNKDLMNLLVVQNQEHQKETQQLKDTIQEMIPKIGNNNTTNNNNTFNLNVFLNEDCKDAINFSEFIDNIQVSFEDLEHQSEIGYVNGISKLFIENLRSLGTYKRPIHCTDKKRKTLYIKENNEWDKEGSQNTLKQGIQEVSRKGFECLSNEKKENLEEYQDIESDFSQKCLLIQRNLIPNAPRETTINKVIENISKNSGIIE